MAIQKASEIFGDITIYPAKDGKQRVEMYIRLQEKVEGMQIGIGIDGSASMRKMGSVSDLLEGMMGLDRKFVSIDK